MPLGTRRAELESRVLVRPRNGSQSIHTREMALLTVREHQGGRRPVASHDKVDDRVLERADDSRRVAVAGEQRKRDSEIADLQSTEVQLTAERSEVGIHGIVGLACVGEIRHEINTAGVSTETGVNHAGKRTPESSGVEIGGRWSSRGDERRQRSRRRRIVRRRNDDPRKSRGERSGG